MDRLETMHVKRQVGVQRALDGTLSPIVRTFSVGHGQQLAARRLAERMATWGAPAIDPDTRQARRRADRKAAKRAARQDQSNAQLMALREMRAKKAVSA